MAKRNDGKTGLYIKSMTIDIEKFSSYSKKQIGFACDKAAVEMLTWMSNGSQKNNTRPPLRWGVLSASGSAFRGGKFLMDTSNLPVKSEDGERPTPNKQLHNTEATGSKVTMTWGFNTDYAAKMHEQKPGPNYKPNHKDPDRMMGNQWVTSHLDSDKDDLQKVIAAFLEAAL
jgi:hypothetical protein